MRAAYDLNDISDSDGSPEVAQRARSSQDADRNQQSKARRVILNVDEKACKSNIVIQ